MVAEIFQFLKKKSSPRFAQKSNLIILEGGDSWSVGNLFLFLILASLLLIFISFSLYIVMVVF